MREEEMWNSFNINNNDVDEDVGAENKIFPEGKLWKPRRPILSDDDTNKRSIYESKWFLTSYLFEKSYEG